MSLTTTAFPAAERSTEATKVAASRCPRVGPEPGPDSFLQAGQGRDQPPVSFFRHLQQVFDGDPGVARDGRHAVVAEVRPAQVDIDIDDGRREPQSAVLRHHAVKIGPEGQQQVGAGQEVLDLGLVRWKYDVARVRGAEGTPGAEGGYDRRLKVGRQVGQVPGRPGFDHPAAGPDGRVIGGVYEFGGFFQRRPIHQAGSQFRRRVPGGRGSKDIGGDVHIDRALRRRQRGLDGGREVGPDSWAPNGA